jgi:hypothetical protein
MPISGDAIDCVANYDPEIEHDPNFDLYDD